jgi:hypothetical protein
VVNYCLTNGAKSVWQQMRFYPCMVSGYFGCDTMTFE